MPVIPAAPPVSSDQLIENRRCDDLAAEGGDDKIVPPQAQRGQRPEHVQATADSPSRPARQPEKEHDCDRQQRHRVGPDAEDRGLRDREYPDDADQQIGRQRASA